MSREAKLGYFLAAFREGLVLAISSQFVWNWKKKNKNYCDLGKRRFDGLTIYFRLVVIGAPRGFFSGFPPTDRTPGKFGIPVIALTGENFGQRVILRGGGRGHRRFTVLHTR